MLIIEKIGIDHFRELTTYSGSLLKKYEQIKSLFLEEAIIFSKPIQNNYYIEWVIEENLPIINYLLASELEQNHIKYILKKQVMSLFNMKIIQEDEDYYELLEYLLEIPNYESIYLVGEKVYLTNWGHIEDRYNAPRQIIKKLIKDIEVSEFNICSQKNTIEEAERVVTEEKKMEGKCGDPRINLKWYDHNDLDLYIVDPCGNQINFETKESFCQDLKGVLDIDANVSEDDLKDKPQENIVWENDGPKGIYTVLVKDANNRTGNATFFKLTIINNGQISYYDDYIEIEDFIEITTFEH